MSQYCDMSPFCDKKSVPTQQGASVRGRRRLSQAAARNIIRLLKGRNRAVFRGVPDLPEGRRTQLASILLY